LSGSQEKQLAAAGEKLSELPTDAPDLTYRLLFGQVILAHRQFEGLLMMLSQLLEDEGDHGKYGSHNPPEQGIRST
jgi:hypothetical protein